ncbi:MAG: hypothetical protein ABJB66_13210 [Gemmatimonadaceae bacterium]
MGIIIGVVFAIRQNTTNAIGKTTEHDGTIVVKFHRDGTFISKPAFVSILNAPTEMSARIFCKSTSILTA